MRTVRSTACKISVVRPQTRPGKVTNGRVEKTLVVVCDNGSRKQFCRFSSFSDVFPETPTICPIRLFIVDGKLQSVAATMCIQSIYKRKLGLEWYLFACRPSHPPLRVPRIVNAPGGFIFYLNDCTYIFSEFLTTFTQTYAFFINSRKIKIQKLANLFVYTKFRTKI